MLSETKFLPELGIELGIPGSKPSALSIKDQIIASPHHMLICFGCIVIALSRQPSVGEELTPTCV